MPRSPHNKAHFRAMAMLLGDRWWYDESDHTFNLEDAEGSTMMVRALDADTMETVYTEQGLMKDVTRAMNLRKAQVARGTIGASDS